MIETDPNILMVEIIVEGLGDLINQFVFVGGSIVSLYVEDKAVREVRPTQDVDCVVKLRGYTNYHLLEQELSKKGFNYSQNEGDPICRKIYKGILVDVMPTDEKVLGFSNLWYLEGIKNKIKVKLPSQKEIFIFPLPYFIACKLEAFKARGGNDPRLSHDMEDIMTILDGLSSLDKLALADDMVVGYLKKNFKQLLSDSLFLECISCHIEAGPINKARTLKLINQLKKFIK